MGDRDDDGAGRPVDLADAARTARSAALVRIFNCSRANV
jgi:hypothetical protein